MFANEKTHPTFESFAEFMAERGYQYVDLDPDDLGKRYANWRYKNYREYEITHVSYLSCPNIWFYKKREVPIPYHPKRGKGRFEAIYFHFFPDHICPVSHIEAEIVNVSPCRMIGLGGEPLNGVSRTTLTRLIPFDPKTFKKLMLIQGAYTSLRKQWQSLTEDKTMNDDIHNIYRKAVDKSQEETKERTQP